MRSQRCQQIQVLFTYRGFSSSHFHSHREATRKSQQVRLCWHPVAVAHAELNTGLDFAWPVLHSAKVPAAAEADWPIKYTTNIEGTSCYKI